MRRSLLWVATGFFSAALLGAPAGAQPTFSVDSQGPTVTAAIGDGFFGVAITDGDILTSALSGPLGPNPALPGPLPPPGIEVGALPGAVGAVPGGLGVLPGLFGCLEVDALSYGFDQGDTLYFSVEEHAAGVPGPLPPDVFSEGILGALEASADVFRYLGPALPTPPGFGPGNTAHIDGDGLAPSRLPGLGLIEPNPPTPGVVPDPGDNLHALDLDTLLPFLGGPIFFSLHAGFLDPLESFPVNCGTALSNGFSGADVLVTFPGGPPMLAISGPELGLDLLGFDTDDLDALIFNDADGTLSLTPPDTLYFSVRRGSAIIGTPDSIWGFPIEEGDILMPPPVPGSPPSIFVSADNLNLGTLRSGTVGPVADELDALDLAPAPPPPTPVPALGPWGIMALIAALASGPMLGLGTGRGRR